MANTPKKAQDPAEAALAAIQDALNLANEDPSKAGRTGGAPRNGDAMRVDDDLFADTRRSEGVVSPSQPPANDDRRDLAQMLERLSRRPSSAPLWIAALLSALWLGGGLFIAFRAYGGALPDPMAPQTLTLAAVLLLPVLFFFVMGALIRRSQEMRIVAQGMSEVALRLAEPETVAREAVVSVGQAIRREVAAMGDGVERALARAGELETLVHNEVASLERAYSDNELRVRALIEELVNQREAIVSNAERVRSAMTGVHEQVASQIAEAGSS